MLDFSVTFVITLVNIAVLTLILRAILFKPVTKFMADRANRIKGSIEQSEKDKAQAKAMLAQYTAQLKNAEAEAGAIIRSAREHAEAEAAKIIAESRAAASETLVTAKKQLEAERGAALALFRKEAASLVVSAAGRLVERDMTSEDSRKYADMLLSETVQSGGTPSCAADSGAPNFGEPSDSGDAGKA